MTAITPPVMRFRASPHFNARPDKQQVSLLVIHNISLPAGVFAPLPQEHSYIDDLFMGVLDCNAHHSFSSLQGLRVSAHCVIWRDGSIVQYVPFEQRAWHAGQSQFNGRDNCNDFSIGIELEGTDNLPYTEQQYHSLAQLTRFLRQCFPEIAPQHIVGHCDIAPGRKTDPGPAFDWQHYRKLIKEN